MEGDSDNDVTKNIRMTRDEAGQILQIDSSATLQEMKRAYRRLALRVYPKELINSEQTMGEFENISAAYKRLTSDFDADCDIVEISGEYPFKLFRKVFEAERHVVRVYTEHGSFIVLGRRYTTRRHSNSSGDEDFDASHYSFQQEWQNGEATERVVAKTKAEKKKLKRQRQRENKRQAKETLQKEREEIKLERQKISMNGTKDVQQQQHESGGKWLGEMDKHTESKVQRSKNDKTLNETQSKPQESKKLVSQYKHKYANIQATEKTKSTKPTHSEPENGSSNPEADGSEDSTEESDAADIDVDCAFFAKSIRSAKIKKSSKNPARFRGNHLPMAIEPLEQSVKKQQDKVEVQNTKITRNVEDDVNKLAAEGNVLAGQQRFKEAVVFFSRAILLDPKNIRVYANRSYCYEMISDFHKALHDAQKVITIAPNWPKGYFRKGRVLMEMKKYMEAESTFEVILELDKGNHDAATELFNVKVKRLEEMGFSKQKSILAIRKYSTVDDAIKEVLAGGLAENAEEDVYVSDDEDIVVPVEQVAAMAIAKTMQHLENNSEDAGTDFSTVGILNESENNMQQRAKETIQVGGVTEPVNSSAVSFEKDGAKRDENWSVNQIQKTKSVKTSNLESGRLRNSPHYALWIGNVTRKITESHLYDYFVSYGAIRSIRMHPDKSYAFVNFMNPGSASLAMNAGREIEIQGIVLNLSYPLQKSVPNKMKEHGSPISSHLNAPGVATKMYPRGGDVPPRHAQSRIAHDTARECYYWRKNGCYNGPNCKFLHIPEHKGIDRL